MTTMTAENLTRSPAQVRRALKDGDEVLLTFHGKPYARVLPFDRAEQERAEMERLRALVDELQAQIDQHQEATQPAA
ncbi:hypothetical protein D5S17_23195 [Pseudonocardiaceae bacterium YIM PH 21723]|nr:hypothetical protein D5S17_23195 [Pseudonocardiaceae bacterium YIM PH 21723]